MSDSASTAANAADTSNSTATAAVELINHWWSQAWVSQLGVTIVLIAVGVIAMRIKRRAIARVSTHGEPDPRRDPMRTAYISKLLGLVIIVLVLIAIGFVWGIKIGGVWVVLSTMFTIVGIALFAAWSLLSNITCAVVMYFAGPFRLGSRITIAEGDGFTGTVEDMTFFHVRLRAAGGSLHAIPNTIVLQRAVTVHAGEAGARTETMPAPHVKRIIMQLANMSHRTISADDLLRPGLGQDSGLNRCFAYSASTASGTRSPTTSAGSPPFGPDPGMTIAIAKLASVFVTKIRATTWPSRWTWYRC